MSSSEQRVAALEGAAAQGSADAGDAWLLVFLNLLLVMLAFFIAVLAIKRQAVPRAPAEGEAADAAAPARERRAAAQALRRRLAALFRAAGVAGMATVDLHEGRPRIVLRSGLVFRSASATLMARARERLRALARTLRPLQRPLMVEGHTDDLPIATQRYPSNWELSTARALSVVRLFMREGIAPQRLEFAGYGQHRPQVPNSNEQNRRQNRRVEIKIK